MKEADQRYLVAAEGWLELGMPDEARLELEQVEPGNREHPDVLKLHWGIANAEKKWATAIDVAQALTLTSPQQFCGWWMLSFALHELKRTQEAYENLASVVDQFKGEYLAHYNLGCYLTQLGRLDEARLSLKRAFALHPAQRAAALEDADLEPLWPELRRL